jgi:hypothetical protein
MSGQLALMFAAGSQPVATSEDAADRLTRDELSRRRRIVLELFAETRTGLTADEVVTRLGGNRAGAHNTWAPRVTELLQYGLLDRLDGKDGRRKERRPTRAGATGYVHVINARGRAEVDRAT